MGPGGSRAQRPPATPALRDESQYAVSDAPIAAVRASTGRFFVCATFERHTADGAADYFRMLRADTLGLATAFPMVLACVFVLYAGREALLAQAHLLRFCFRFRF